MRFASDAVYQLHTRSALVLVAFDVIGVFESAAAVV